MKKYRNVVDHAAFTVALVMRGVDVTACDVIVVRDFAVVSDGRFTLTGLSVASAAYQCIVVVYLLLSKSGLILQFCLRCSIIFVSHLMSWS